MQLTATALSWLETILAERFGHALRLAKHEKSVLVTLPSVAGHIEIRHENTEFSPINGNVAFAEWNAEAEGWATAIHGVLPAPGATRLITPLIEPTTSGFRIHYDILSLAKWMLSRVEEIDSTDLDEHGRFSATASHAFRNGYLERPIVDEWLYVLAQVISHQWPNLLLKKNEFSVKVSHDVDEPSPIGFSSYPRVLRSVMAAALKRRNFREAFLAPLIKLNTRSTLYKSDPFNTFDWIMDASEKNGLQSAFYFICGRTDHQKDALYELEHPAIRDLLRRIHARGHEIGLHPSYNTYRKEGAIAGEFQRLRRVCSEESIEQDEWGGRMHYLRWEHPTTMLEWAKAGLTYDSTLGYADRPGFRCGTCFDYQAYDFTADEIIPLRIRPLIVMECSITAQRYMNLGKGNEALSKFLRMKKNCRAVSGSFNILWHNSELIEIEDKIIFKRTLAN